ncbi:glycosyltransferase family 39 protein [Campylobacter sp. 2018MI35]|uniref:glycosyltransferase family 39 protein n=1 Tax=Campylobacter sp. 2018MI34 TaxID=2800582 RepID=UPI001903DBED|nr:glycosyltransferase family 39 protein [Campylobacter sp. 2018MI34]MBK1992020.1 glycosyltransferase family 39 protein [Campylobacter sp. 2018MI34]
MKENRYLKYFILLLSLDLLALFYGISTLSISGDEAKIYFDTKGLLYYITHFGTFILGVNDFGLRMPFVIIHILSCILLYLLAKKYNKTDKDVFFSLFLFILLPGSVAGALLVNEASYVIFLSLAILCAYEYEKKNLFFLLLFFSLFVDKSFIVLFLTFFFFGIYKRDIFLFSFSFFLFLSCVFLYGFDVGGKPKGYFLDILGIFSLCFSPLVFVYFFYVIYRLAFKKNKNLLWFLISTTFIFCSLLSLRQKLSIEDFLPFCVICTPLLIKALMQSYRVRLPEFRSKYKILIRLSVLFLIVFYLLILGNYILYFFIKDPKLHFAHNYHIAKELSVKLKEEGISAIHTTSRALQRRLRFYGIKDSSSLYLKDGLRDKNLKTIAIKLGKHKINYQLSYEKSF